VGILAPRAEDARFFIPTLAEWRKAGLWQPPHRAGLTEAVGGVPGFWRFPSMRDPLPDTTRTAAGHLTDPHQFNILRAVTGRDAADPLVPTLLHLTPAGAYVATRSWFGTWDQGGNAGEMVETTEAEVPGTRLATGGDALRGGQELLGGGVGVRSRVGPGDVGGLRAAGFRMAGRLGVTGYDGGELAFAAAAQNAATTTNPARVVVRRRGGTGTGIVSVAYAAAAGTAVPPADFTPVSGVLTFAADEDERTIEIPFTPSAFAGSGKTIRLRLNQPTGGAILGYHDGTELRIAPEVAAPAIAITRTYITPGATALSPGTGVVPGGVDRFTPAVTNFKPNGFVVVIYEVRNTGTATLGLDQWRLTSLDNCTAEVFNTLPATTIAPGGTAVLQASISVGDPSRPWAASWSFSGNLPGMPTASWIMASATGTPVQEATLAVERVARVPAGGTDRVDHSRAGSPVDLAYVVRVDGIGSTPVALPATTGAVNAVVTVVRPPPASLVAGTWATVRLRVTPTGAGAWSVPVAVVGAGAASSRSWTIRGHAAPSGPAAPPVVDATYRIRRGGGLPLLIQARGVDGPPPVVVSVGAPGVGTLVRVTSPASGGPVTDRHAYIYRAPDGVVGTTTIPVTYAAGGTTIPGTVTIHLDPAPEIEVRLGPALVGRDTETTLAGSQPGRAYHVRIAVHNTGDAPLVLGQPSLAPGFGDGGDRRQHRPCAPCLDQLPGHRHARRRRDLVVPHPPRQR
jgi:hypothetical protein